MSGMIMVLELLVMGHILPIDRAREKTYRNKLPGLRSCRAPSCVTDSTMRKGFFLNSGYQPYITRFFQIDLTCFIRNVNG